MAMHAAAVREIVEWTTLNVNKRQAEFGHVHVTTPRFTKGTLKHQVATQIAHGHTDVLILLVGGVLENSELSARGLKASGSYVPVTYTYGALLDLFRENRNTEENSPRWKAAVQPQGWAVDRVLPRNVVVIFTIEPNFSAACALALIETVRWACDIGEQDESLVRVLTWGSSPIPVSFRRLVDACTAYQGLCVTFRLRDREEERSGLETNIMCIGDFDQGKLKDKLLSNIMANANGVHAVIGFGPSKSLQVLGQIMSQPTVANHTTKSEVLRSMASDEIEACMEVRSRLTYITMPDAGLCPAKLHDFSDVHLICGSTRTASIYDTVTGQITQMEVELSEEERSAQMWAVLSQNDMAVHVYVDAETEFDYIKQSHVSRQLDLDNHHVGGFIAAVCGLAPWRVGNLRTLQCFIRYPQTLYEFSARLVQQGVLSSDLSGKLEMKLSGAQKDIFVQVLPMVDYDYRIALFLALPSLDGRVSLTKIHLAALLAQGPMETVRFHRPATESDPTIPEMLGRGPTIAFAHTSTLLLVLELWNLVRRKSDDFATQRGQQYVYVMQRRMRIDVPRSFRICNMISRLTSSLRCCGVTVAGWSSESLQREQCDSLHRDLLSAFLYQLVLSWPEDKALEGSKQAWEHQDVSTRNIMQQSSEWIDYIDFEQVSMGQLAPEMVFGVCHELTRREGVVKMINWTWIPMELVADWMVSQPDGETIFSILSGGHRPRQ